MNREVVVYDSEWTAWEGSWQNGWSTPGQEVELVQIGMAKLRGDTFLEVDQIELLLKPIINPHLSDYFINLTGITQANLDAHGIEFVEAIEIVAQFLGKNVSAIYSFGDDGKILFENCNLQGINAPFSRELFVNVVPDVSKFLGIPRKNLVSSNLPRLMGFEPPGDAHTALADARCVGKALEIMRRSNDF
ncbi:MAG: hypothetical protein CBB68_07645 [Rhodospirillaceae bacterium TMED8]|nr:hypothetical protein [Magnetovibrio sp.]OUT50856.1 MAG: hypothetical protein CBB68_07645 [Rhodospirillaceae bacterium TMED8]|tara:strand:+ start:582 stop:1151 length:570 start_codon:yes stop_codon:yes gene_type:complete